MMFAVAVMSPTVTMLFYGAAVVLFAIGAIGYQVGKLSFMSAGLAMLAFPFFWNALAAT